MKILLIGTGGREHALAWKISQSPLLEKLYCLLGNPGMAELGEAIALNIDDYDAVADFCLTHKIDLVVIGPEQPLVNGLSDVLRTAGIYVFGPSRAAAQLEGSKGFTKDLCAQYAIPTARYCRFHEPQAAKAYIKEQGAPIVIKADGLAAGKGVTVALSLEEAYSAVDVCFSGVFGQAGTELIVEEFLQGEEVSFFCLCNGDIAVPFGTAQDHKRVGEGDTGPNTGGMGAYSPALILTSALQIRVMEEIIKPTLQAICDKGMPFNGVLFAGLMLTQDGPKLIEYNVRFGDPECQTLMMRLADDLVPFLFKVAQGQLTESDTPNWHDEVVLNVVMAARGYPATPEKGSVIVNLAEAQSTKGVHILHAGTDEREGKLIANGGRVLNIVAHGCDIVQARQRAYDAIAKINWPQGFYRRDIGLKAIKT